MEMTDHLGYEKHDAAGKQTGNSRNGIRLKTVLTETTGPVEIDVPPGPGRKTTWRRRGTLNECCSTSESLMNFPALAARSR